jgi:hypothetical protein
VYTFPYSAGNLAAMLWLAAAPEGAKEPYRERLKRYQDRKPYRLE